MISFNKLEIGPNVRQSHVLEKKIKDFKKR